MRIPSPIRLCLSLFVAPLFLHSAGHAHSALREAHEADTVAWRNWSPAAREAATSEDKPLFFFVSYYGNSLGRAMLSETFQNKTIAATVNETTIPILVDLNEEPELASLLAQMAFEHFEANNWPICIWTDAELAPLNGGGYFPPTDDWGGQGYLSLARNVSEQWLDRREEFVAQASERKKSSLSVIDLADRSDALANEALDTNSFAPSDAPSLPAIEFYNSSLLLPSLPKARSDELLGSMSNLLSSVISGAGFDSVSGGFFAGSNDPNWRLPLFQKSSVDQALMMSAISELHKLQPNPEYEDLARLTVAFARNDLEKKNGLLIQYLEGFAKGETPDMAEGSYYLFDSSDVAKISADAQHAWGLSSEGNLDSNADILGLYQGQNVPYSSELSVLDTDHDALRDELRKLRSKKSKPLADSTANTASNAFWISSLCRASEAFDDSSYLDYAVSLYSNLIKRNANDALGELYNSDARNAAASSLDFAHLIAASLDLHERTGTKRYLENANSLLALWNKSERFETQNPLLLPTGVMNAPAANYMDALLPSAAATHLSNLSRLQKIGALTEPFSQAQQSLLSTTPAFVERAPESFFSLLAIARNR